MFKCVSCGERYLLEDVKDGLFFPSSSMCLSCYYKRYKDSKLCFGDKDKYNMRTLPCQECPDNKQCRTMAYHYKEFRGE